MNGGFTVIYIAKPPNCDNQLIIFFTRFSVADREYILDVSLSRSETLFLKPLAQILRLYLVNLMRLTHDFILPIDAVVRSESWWEWWESNPHDIATGGF